MHPRTLPQIRKQRKNKKYDFDPLSSPQIAFNIHYHDFIPFSSNKLFYLLLHLEFFFVLPSTINKNFKFPSEKNIKARLSSVLIIKFLLG